MVSIQELFDRGAYEFTAWLMNDFRSGKDDGWWAHLTEDERIELFVAMLTGGSDLSRALLQRVCDEYGEDLTDVLNR